MPTVPVVRQELFQALGQTYTDKDFDILCFEFGIELDDIEFEVEDKTIARAKGEQRAVEYHEVEETVKGKTVMVKKEGHWVYKIDVPANRYDLLCSEGLSRALRVFIGKEAPPAFKMTNPKKKLVMTVKGETDQIRPYVVCAVLRNLTLGHLGYNSFLDLQDKLHFNICRRRTLVAIGTHDLDAIKPPFTYEALPPKDIKFVPLQQTKEYDAAELMQYYLNDPEGKHIKPYVDIILDSPVYPVIYDANRTVLSLPPIINGSHSKISKDTKNCFIECTATDLTKAKIVLNTLVAMFSQYCAEPFTVEPVEVRYTTSCPALLKGEKVNVYPDMSTRDVETSVEECCSTIGQDIPLDKICTLCSKMMLQGRPSKDNKSFIATVPVTRSDILHPVDVIEDVAIAFGYNNLKMTVPPVNTVGKEQPINHLADLLCDEVARAGYIQMMTLGLCSTAESFDLLLRKDDPLKKAVTLANPQTKEFEVVRTSLLPGTLKTLQHNIALPKPIKLFEVTDVVYQDGSTDTGAKNERHLIAMFCGNTSGMELIHGLVDLLMRKMEVYPLGSTDKLSPAEVKEAYGSYKLIPRGNADGEGTFIPGQVADISVIKKRVEENAGSVGYAFDGEPMVVGTVGVLHPQVLVNFGVDFPASVVELNIEPFCV